MALDTELEELAPDTIEVLNVTALNAFQGGEHTYPAIGSGTSYIAHLNVTMPETDEDNGESVSPHGRITFMQPIAIDPRAHVVLPTRFSPREVSILSVKTPVDDEGEHHTIVEI